MFLFIGSCDPLLLRWCCPQTCPLTYSKSKPWRPVYNNKNGNAAEADSRISVTLACVKPAFKACLRCRTQQKQICALCFLKQDRQAQSAVSVTPHGWHKPSIEALGAALSLDQSPDGGVFPAGRNSNRCACTLFLFALAQALAGLFILSWSNTIDNKLECFGWME